MSLGDSVGEFWDALRDLDFLFLLGDFDDLLCLCGLGDLCCV